MQGESENSPEDFEMLQTYCMIIYTCFESVNIDSFNGIPLIKK